MRRYPARSGTWRMAMVLVGAVLASTAALWTVATPASAAICTNSWNAAVSGDWEVGANWSAGHAPTGAEGACIEANGTYTVAISSHVTVGSLAIGTTTTSGTQSLVVGGPAPKFGSVSAAGGIENGPRGSISIERASLDVFDSTLVNSGTITSQGVPDVTHILYGDLTNTATGTLAINHATEFRTDPSSSPAALLNQGTIAVGDGQALTSFADTTITHAASGQINATGTGRVNSTGVFNEAGTTSGSKPVTVGNGTLNYTGNGASKIEVGVNAINMTGVMHSGQELTIKVSVFAVTGFENRGGQMTLDSNAAITVQDSTLLNSGTITTQGAAGTVILYGNLTNAPAGTLAINHPGTEFRRDPSGTANPTLLNQGTIAVGNGQTLTSFSDTTITHAATGQINATGTGRVNSSGIFNEAGTTSGTRPVTVTNGTLNYTGNGASKIEAPLNAINMTGVMHSGQELTIKTNVFATSGFENRGGQMTFDASAGHVAITVGANTLLNSGTITAQGVPANLVDFLGNLTNTGTLAINHANTRYLQDSAPATLLNQGTLTIAPEGTLSFGGGTTFTQSAGRTTLVNANSRIVGSMTLTGGILEGIGTIQGNVTNGGEVRPGSSPGTLTVQGNYTQTADGVLVAEITNAANDLLHATGTATLDGTLEIETEAGFTPTLGNTYKIVDGSSRSGQFADVNGSNSGPYEILYNAADVTLRVIEASNLPSLSIDDVSVEEGDSGTTNATFTVGLSIPQNFQVTVDFRTANGTAYAPEDYSATTGTLSFAAGDVQEQLTVPVKGDTAPEPDETFQVNLRNPDGAQIGRGRGIGTIRNNEIDISAVTPTRGGGGGMEMVVHGAGLVPGAALRLSRAGESDIVATDVRVAADGRALAGVLDLAGRPQGLWDVTVANPTGRGSETLPGAFTIEATRPPEPWIQLLGPSRVVKQTNFRILISYGNLGNVDASGVVIRFSGIPGFNRFDTPVSYPPSTGSDAVEGRSLKYFIPRLGAGKYASIPINGQFDEPGEYTLHARLTTGEFDPAAVPAIDPGTQVTPEVLEVSDPATSPARLRGIYHVTGPQGGDISFDTTVTNASVHQEPVVGLSEPSPGVRRYTLQGTTGLTGQIKAVDSTMEGPAAAFEGLLRAAPPPGASARPGGVADGPDQPAFPARASSEDRGPNEINPLDIDSVRASTSATELISNTRLMDCLFSNGIFTSDDYAKANKAANGAAGWGALWRVPPLITGPAGTGWNLHVTAQREMASVEFAVIVRTALRRKEIIDEFVGSYDAVIVASALCNPLPNPFSSQHARLKMIVGASADPNEKVGPAGAGTQRFIEGGDPVPYTIKFENLATATAPAQEVVVTDQLDATKLDLSTLSLGPVSFGAVYAGPPPGLQHWTTDIDLRPEKNVIVRIEGDLAGSTLQWRLQSLDADTLLPATDFDAGFLPPNVNPPEGDGFVSFSASPVGALPSGSEIQNSASIVFDTNAPILTNTFLNTIDNDLPTSRVDAASQSGGNCTTDLSVQWSGADPGSGIDSFDVYVSRDGAEYELWRFETTQTSGTYLAEIGHTYGFFSVARDGAGHAEAAPATADATATPACQGAGDTTAPDTTITKGPKKKAKKKKTTFEFAAVSPEAGVKFECQLDSNAFAPCSSPTTVKVKKGKHTFKVRAIDAAGNVDATPASQSWTYKKKKKRK